MGSKCTLAVITAIAGTTPFAMLAEDSGRIYVYAQRLTAARSWRPISCDGAVVAELKRGMFFAINVPPGRYALSAGTSVPAFVDVRQGEESFVRLDWNFELGRPAIPVLDNVGPGQARKEMMYLSYINAKKVLSSSGSEQEFVEPRADWGLSPATC